MDTVASGIDLARQQIGHRILERSDDVLWTIAPPGILLHNFREKGFLELDALGYSIWGFLDGARTVDEAVKRATAGIRGDQRARALTIVETLAFHRFVTERSR